jgi:hypothetical protein
MERSSGAVEVLRGGEQSSGWTGASKNVPAPSHCTEWETTTPAIVLRDVKQNIPMTFSIQGCSTQFLSLLFDKRDNHSDNYCSPIILTEGVEPHASDTRRPTHIVVQSRAQRTLLNATPNPTHTT